jgi:hypothetical protein
VTQLQILLKVEFTTLCHVQKGATCLRFEPGCWVTSFTSGERKKTQDSETGVGFAALNVPDLFFVWVGFKERSSNTGILNP